MAAPCPVCQGIDCFDQEDTDLYSIESPTFPFVLNCPSGYDCNSSDSINMICCGQVLSSPLPPSLTADQRNLIITSIVNQCQSRNSFCNVPPGNPTQLYFNTPQACSVTCPDGTVFTFTANAGTFLAADQATANLEASQFACVQASAQRACLGSILTSVCSGQNCSTTIGVTGGIGPFSFAILSGTLPPGLVINSISGTISGHPTTPGTYDFTVRVTTHGGGTAVKSFEMLVNACCPDALTNSTDLATLVSWTTPAKFSFRYAMTLALGEIQTFQVKVPANVPNAADLVQIYTGAGVVANSGQARFLAGTQLNDQFRYLQVFVYGITPGNYLLEITVPTTGTVLIRESNDFTSQAITTNGASPRTHDGLNNFAAVFDFNWKAGDCYALWGGHVGSAPYLRVYNSAFVSVPITANANFSSLTDDWFIVVPADGLYHVEVALTGAAVGQLLMANCCAVRGDFTPANAPSTPSVPFQPVASVTVSGSPTSFIWGFSRETQPLAPSASFTVKATGTSQIPCPNMEVTDMVNTTKVWMMIWRAGIVQLKNHFGVEITQLAVAPFISPWPGTGSNLNYQIDYTVTASGWTDVATGIVTLINADTNEIYGTAALVPAAVVGQPPGRANCVIHKTLTAEQIYNIKAVYSGDTRYFPATAPTIASWVPALEIQVNQGTPFTDPTWDGLMVMYQFINSPIEATPRYHYHALNPPATYIASDFEGNYNVFVANKWSVELTPNLHTPGITFTKDDPQLGSPVGSYSGAISGVTITPVP